MKRGQICKGRRRCRAISFFQLNQRKKRPALVITQLNRDDAIVCQITKQNVPDGYSIELKSEEFSKGSLPIDPSYIRLNRLFTVDTNIVERKAGSLTKAKVDGVIEKIIAIIS